MEVVTYWLRDNFHGDEAGSTGMAFEVGEETVKVFPTWGNPEYQEMWGPRNTRVMTVEDARKVWKELVTKVDAEGNHFFTARN